MTTIGIIGAGKVGTAVARLAIAAGDEVLIAGSPNAQFLEQILALTAPGARVASLDELAEAAELTVLAVPFGKIDTVDLERFTGAVVVDAANYWEPVDGSPAILAGAGALSTSEVVQGRHPGVRLVKSLNHLGYHDMDTDAAPAGSAGRRAVAVAADDAGASDIVASFLDRIGFDPVHVGALADGAILQPGEALFGRFVQRAELLAVAVGRRELAA